MSRRYLSELEVEGAIRRGKEVCASPPSNEMELRRHPFCKEDKQWARCLGPATHPWRCTTSLVALVACFVVALSQRVIARDLTDADILDIRSSAYGLVGGRDRVLGLRAWWAEDENAEVLIVWAVMRPVETSGRLCAMEEWRLRRRDGDAWFERDDTPTMRYWPRRLLPWPTT